MRYKDWGRLYQLLEERIGTEKEIYKNDDDKGRRNSVLQYFSRYHRGFPFS